MFFGVNGVYRKFVQFLAAQYLETLLCGQWLEVIRVGLFRGVFEGLSVCWVERSVAHKRARVRVSFRLSTFSVEY